MIDLSRNKLSLVSEKSKVRAKCRDIGLKSALHIPGLAGWVRRAGMKAEAPVQTWRLLLAPP